MKTTLALSVSSVVLGVLCAGAIPSLVQAEERDSHKCSAKTLQGAYGVKFEGQKLGTGPFVSVSRIVFDGVGTFTSDEIGRFNGAPVQRTFTGPYTVNQDCTGFLDFSSNLSDPPHEATGNLVIVNKGQEFFIVDNEDGWAANGVGKRQ
ncbi:MAG: hypothetical protein NTX45_02525 [Proteobacteria bacterium]|nr:hypothetical protein [Pseudomonadota bacterium]